MKSTNQSRQPSDPIFAMIAEHRRILKAYDKTVRDPRGDIDPVFELYQDASERLFRTVPTTVAGVLAMLDYIVDSRGAVVEHWVCGGIGFPRVALSSIRRGPREATAAAERNELTEDGDRGAWCGV